MGLPDQAGRAVANTRPRAIKQPQRFGVVTLIEAMVLRAGWLQPPTGSCWPPMAPIPALLAAPLARSVRQPWVMALGPAPVQR
jgi:hypothetical protein